MNASGHPTEDDFSEPPAAGGSKQGTQMTYTLVVLDRGRPIAKHPKLDHETGLELVGAYRAIGWPQEKVQLTAESPDYEERAAA